MHACATSDLRRAVLQRGGTETANALTSIAAPV